MVTCFATGVGCRSGVHVPVEPGEHRSASLPRRLLAQFPGRVDAADEDETGIVGVGHVDGNLALAHLCFYGHRFSGPIPTFASLRSGHFCACQNQRTTNKYKFPVEFWI